MKFSDVIAAQLQYTDYVIRHNADGVTDDEALVQPDPGGNCFNWIVGHILSTRHGFLAVLDQEMVWDEDTRNRYRRSSDPVSGAGNGVIPLSQMLADLVVLQERTVAGLASLDDATLAEKAAFSPGNNPNETVGSLLVILAFHESYHAGQTGILRKLIGKSEGYLT